jgi:hypothetical protein
VDGVVVVAGVLVCRLVVARMGSGVAGERAACLAAVVVVVRWLVHVVLHGFLLGGLVLRRAVPAEAQKVSGWPGNTRRW